MCRWKTIIYSCGHANPYSVFLHSCTYEREIQRYEAFRMRSEYKSTAQREASAFESVLDLRHQCEKEKSPLEEFSKMKCKDCVNEEGWGYAKTGYFKRLENEPKKLMDFHQQQKENVTKERSECAVGDMLDEAGGEIHEPVERKTVDEKLDKENGNSDLEADYRLGYTCDMTITFLCSEKLSGGIEA